MMDFIAQAILCVVVFSILWVAIQDTFLGDLINVILYPFFLIWWYIVDSFTIGPIVTDMIRYANINSNNYRYISINLSGTNAEGVVIVLKSGENFCYNFKEHNFYYTGKESCYKIMKRLKSKLGGTIKTQTKHFNGGAGVFFHNGTDGNLNVHYDYAEPKEVICGYILENNTFT